MPPHVFDPRCVPVPGAGRYVRKAVRNLSFDGSTLTLDVQGEGFAYARVVFRNVFGFRVLDEFNLTEFWNTYSEPSGWLWEVQSGGWHDLERMRETFNPGDFVSGLREFFVVDNKCVNILCQAAPEILDFGAEPPERSA